MTSPTGALTAAAGVRDVAPPAPLATALDQLTDQLGALEISFSALNQRLAPVMRDDSYDPIPELPLGARQPEDPSSVDTRGEVLRRLEALTRGIAAVTRDVDRATSRLEV